MNAFEVCFLNSITGTTGIPKIVEWTVAARLWSKTHVRNWQLNSDDILCAIALVGGAGRTPTYFCAPQAGAKVVLLMSSHPESCSGDHSKGKSDSAVPGAGTAGSDDAGTGGKLRPLLTALYPLQRGVPFSAVG